MLYHLLYPLARYFGGFNVFRYITFRAAYAAITALLLSFLLGPWLIRRLRRTGARELIREDVPSWHKRKGDTPTMGGVLLISATVLPTLLWADLANVQIQLASVVVLGLGLVGFIDDYLKTFKRKEVGLRGRYKILGTIAVGALLGGVIAGTSLYGDLSTKTTLPFLKNVLVPLGILYVPFVIIVITGSSNAANLADGLDGLAIGLSIPPAAAFGALAYVSGHVKFAHYLNIPYLRGAGELTIFCSAFVGAALGFLWYNSHPAEIFMGDTGSLAVGGAIGAVAVLIKREVLLVVVGGVFVAEALSVIIQVLAYKSYGRRVFRMAPLHHHFEMAGMAESKVVIRFWIVGILLALLTLSTVKLQ